MFKEKSYAAFHRANTEKNYSHRSIQNVVSHYSNIE
jgi:hypothetical protein